MPENIEVKTLQQPIFLATEDAGIVESIVNLYGILDHGNDIVQMGAFADAIADNTRVLNHHQARSIENVLGRCLELREINASELPAVVRQAFPEATGALWARTQFNLETVLGRTAYELIKAGDVKEYSIGFYLKDYETRKENEITIREIIKGDLVEYSPVIWGQNPGTATLDVKEGDPPRIKEDEPDDGETPAATMEPSFPFRNIKNGAEIMGVIADLLGNADDSPVQKQHTEIEVQKALAPVLTPDQVKAIAITDRVTSVRIQFYAAFRDTMDTYWWVTDVYDDYLIAVNFYDHLPMRVFQVGYEIGAGFIVNFDEPVEGMMSFQKYDFDSTEEMDGGATLGDDDDDEETRKQAELQRLKDQELLNELDNELKELQ